MAYSDRGVVAYSLGVVHETFYVNGPVAWLEEIMVDSKCQTIWSC